MRRLRGPERVVRGVFNPPPPPNQRTRGLYALKTIDVTLKGIGGKPFVPAPKTCKASWPSAITIANFDGPNITVRDKAACWSGKKKQPPARRGTERDRDDH